MQVANLGPTLLKPMSRGTISLKSADAPEPLVEFNFLGHDLDLKRFMQAFRMSVEVLAHEKVRAMISHTFPVKFDDRLRVLNRLNAKNKIQSAVVAKLIDLVPPLAGPIFATLADRRVDLEDLVKDDEALADHIRRNVAGTFHPVGTCRMSADAERPRRGDRYAGPRARLRGPARDRRLDHADGAARQHQYPDHDGGGEDFGGDERGGVSKKLKS